MSTTVSIMSGQTNPDNETYMKDLVKNGEDLKVVGVVQPCEDANAVALSTGNRLPGFSDRACGRSRRKTVRS